MGKPDSVTEEVNTTKEFPPSNNFYSYTYNHGWRNHPNFLSSSQNIENP